MNPKYLSKSAKLVALAAILSYGANLHATTSPTAQALSVSVAGQNQPQPMAFSDSAEAGMLRNAYIIMATGDHDYKGHRVRAMHQIEAAARFLGMDITGSAKDRQPQPLSDGKLREAEGLLQNVLGAAEVQSQKRVTKHINEAINQINIALSLK
jgi:hypothetical protein